MSHLRHGLSGPNWGPALWTALVTPLDQGGVPCWPDLQHLLAMQEAACAGIVLFGSTGEGYLLSQDIKKRILDHVCAKKRVSPIFISIPALNLDQALTWMHIAQDYPVDGYLVTPPLYTRPGAQGQKQWFSHIFQGTRRKIMLYQNPRRVGCPLEPDSVAWLWARYGDQANPLTINQGQFLGIKYSDALENFAPYKASGVPIYAGDDGILAPLLSQGAVGLVSILSNVAPMWIAKGLDFKQDQSARVFEGQNWTHLSAAVAQGVNPLPIKVLMHQRGLLSSPRVIEPLCLEDWSQSHAQTLAQCAEKLWPSDADPEKIPKSPL